MSVISNYLACQLFKNGELDIVPRPSPDNVSASLDLRLGRWFITMRDNRFPILDIGDNEGRAMENIGIEEFDRLKATSNVSLLDVNKDRIV